MRTRDRAPNPGIRSSATLIAAVLLAGCTAESSPDREAAAASPAAETDCLVLVWEQQGAPDREFDRAHDLTEGGAISCATGSSASQFEAALGAIREAAGRRDKAALLEQLGVPLLYIDGAGNRRELSQPAAVEALFDEVFSPETLALLERVRLEELTVVAGQGAFAELGALWLVVDEPGGRPKIATVNRQALDEAAAAARRAAREGETTPAPLVD
jgi:hypothetical protein